jgi:thiosulfate reductase/polysulfide reductase chain A
MEDERRFDGCGQDNYPIADPAHGVGAMFPVAVLNEDPYPIKVLFAFRLDPLYSIPDLNQNLKAFEKLDLIVSIDINYGGTTWMSDVILPESTFLERADPIRMFPGLKPAPYRRVPCVKPRYDARPGWWIVKALAERLDVGEYFPYDSIEDIWKYQLADIGLKPEDFEEKGFVELCEKPIWWDRENGLKFNVHFALSEDYFPYNGGTLWTK